MTEPHRMRETGVVYRCIFRYRLAVEPIHAAIAQLGQRPHTELVLMLIRVMPEREKIDRGRKWVVPRCLILWM
jgi:hypothetical protein